jgi:drug/metabolite transporter (DMT)-like permease
MKPFDVFLAVLVAVTWGLGFVASRICVATVGLLMIGGTVGLLRDYTATQVAPFALLVPFFGAGASSVVFGETFGSLRLTGMLTVVGGIAIILLSKRQHTMPKRALPKIA